MKKRYLIVAAGFLVCFAIGRITHYLEWSFWGPAILQGLIGYHLGAWHARQSAQEKQQVPPLNVSKGGVNGPPTNPRPGPPPRQTPRRI